MKKIELGISLYPEQETIEEIKAYVKLASQYGFKRIFTSLFSVEGSKEEVIAYFKQLCDIAHENNMKVYGDCNPGLFDRLNATESDLSAFAQMGIDGLRMDLAYNDERDITLVNNEYGIKIVFNSTVTYDFETLLEKVSLEDISVCHNFYPQRYSGISFESFNETNAFFKEMKIPVEAFISSNVDHAHGPWPVYDGLVTVEDMRDLPIDAQVRLFLTLDNVDIITIANAFASEEEFKAIQETMNFYMEDFPKFVMLGGMFKVEFAENRHIFDIVEAEGLTEAEKKLVYDFKLHMDIGDGFNYFIRSRMTRFGNKDLNIEYRDPGKPYFERGDVVIVNNNCRHYMGEVQIVLKPMKNDGQRNLVGTINEKEQILIDYVGPRELIYFKKEK